MLTSELLQGVICFSSLSIWIFSKKEISIAIAIGFSFLTFFMGFISYPSLLLIVLFALSCHFYISLQNKIIRFLLTLLIAFFAAIAMKGGIPFSNPVPIFEGIKFSSISAPFWMGINIEKAVCGIILTAYIIKRAKTFSEWKTIFKEFIPVLLILIILLFTPAIFTGFVKLNYKIPDGMYLFILNNLLLTSVAEEVFFRGFLQKKLFDIFSINFKMKDAAPLLSILITSVIFGLGHLYSGVLMAIFAFIAGIGYGYAYQKSWKLESAILVHFGLNITHFIFFTYPYYKI